GSPHVMAMRGRLNSEFGIWNSEFVRDFGISKRFDSEFQTQNSEFRIQNSKFHPPWPHDPQPPLPQLPLPHPPEPQPVGLSHPPSSPQPPCTTPLAFGNS